MGFLIYRLGELKSQLLNPAQRYDKKRTIFKVKVGHFLK